MLLFVLLYIPKRHNEDKVHVSALLIEDRMTLRHILLMTDVVACLYCMNLHFQSVLSTFCHLTITFLPWWI